MNIYKVYKDIDVSSEERTDKGHNCIRDLKKALFPTIRQLEKTNREKEDRIAELEIEVLELKSVHQSEVKTLKEKIDEYQEINNEYWTRIEELQDQT